MTEKKKLSVERRIMGASLFLEVYADEDDLRYDTWRILEEAERLVLDLEEKIADEVFDGQT
ncbi:hypothetical protein [Phytoactinopolyspora halophila]|uniref:hypothetical protein n=1 Tax=Phytoactinopolyspora halophila TaxID=1981511 RepID=UPI000F4D7E32|nr:hypothetical protein [Phytoactinopolyspora halophila]